MKTAPSRSKPCKLDITKKRQPTYIFHILQGYFRQPSTYFTFKQWTPEEYKMQMIANTGKIIGTYETRATLRVLVSPVS